MDLEARLLEQAAALGIEVWCVGGCVRDRLLGVRSNDLDVVARGAGELARRLAKATRQAFVPLDPERGHARVAGPLGQIDLAELAGERLDDDLRKRDFTLNAIACPLAAWRTDAPVYIDPTGGRRDLAERTIRAVSPRSLLDDPLRSVRAFRFSALLGFAIEPDTLARVREAAPRLDRVASERVLDEWVKVMAAHGAPQAVAAMDEHGVLAALFPDLPPGRGLRLGPLEALLAPLADRPRLAGWLAGPERLAMLRSAAVLGPLGEGPAPAAVTERLALSRQQQRLLQALRAPVAADLAGGDADAVLAELAFERDADAVGVVVLAALRGEIGAERYESLLARLADAILPRLAAPPLVDGHDLQALGHAPGPAFKRVLADVRRRQLAGTLSTRDEALARARTLMEDEG